MLSSSGGKRYEPIIPKPLFYVALAITIGIVLAVANHAYNISREFIQSSNAGYPMRIEPGWFMDYQQVCIFCFAIQFNEKRI